MPGVPPPTFSSKYLSQKILQKSGAGNFLPLFEFALSFAGKRAERGDNN